MLVAAATATAAPPSSASATTSHAMTTPDENGSTMPPPSQFSRDVLHAVLDLKSFTYEFLLDIVEEHLEKVSSVQHTCMCTVCVYMGMCVFVYLCVYDVVFPRSMGLITISQCNQPLYVVRYRHLPITLL